MHWGGRDWQILGMSASRSSLLGELQTSEKPIVSQTTLSSLAVVAHAFDSSSWGQRQVDVVHRVISRTARPVYTQKPCLEK